MYQVNTSRCPFLKLNYFISMLAGFLFFGGWWMMIDVNVQYQSLIEDKKIYHMPGIVATIMMIFVNAIPNDILNDTYYSSSSLCTPDIAKIFLLFTLMGCFGCLIGASFIFVNDFLLQSKADQWPGYGIFLQNLCIFISNVMMRFCRRVRD